MNRDNSYQFKIYHGSGHFNVNLNNTDIADLDFKERTITIYPKREGSLEIRIEDAEIP